MSALKNKLTDGNISFEDRLRILCGYVENGSDTSVKVYQDDATKDWVVRVGNKGYYASTMMDAFKLAFADPSNNPF